MNILIKVFKQGLARLLNPPTDLLIEFSLQSFESHLDLFRCAAFLIDGQDPPLEVHARLKRA